MQRIVQDERILIDAEEEMLGWKFYFQHAIILKISL